MRVIVCIAMVVFLSGCGSINKARTPFSSKNPLITGNFVEVTEVDGKEKKVKRSYLKEKGIVFIDSYRAVKASDTEANRRAFVSNTLTYSRLLCHNFFNGLVFSHAHREFAKSETNLTGGLLSASLGLAEVNSKVVGGVGALFSFAESSFDAYNSAFLVSTDLAVLEELVRESQFQEEVKIYAKLNADSSKNWPQRITSLSEAERALDAYIGKCTVNGMRTLLNETLRAKTQVLKAQRTGESS